MGLAILAAAGPATAADPNPNAPEWVDAGIVIDFESLDLARIEATFEAHKLTLPKPYNISSAAKIRQTYQGLARITGGEESGPVRAFVADVERTVETRFAEAAAKSFPGASLATVAARLDTATMARANGPDAYQPPVRITLEAELDYPLDGLGFPGLTLAKADAALATGARIDTQFTLTALAGWNATYRVTMPERIVFESVSGGNASEDRGSATWSFDNWLSSMEADGAQAITFAGRDASRHDERDASVDVQVDMRTIDLDLLGATRGDYGTVHVDIGLVVLVDAIELPPAMRGRLPSTVHLTHIGADGIRIALRDGLLTAEELEETSDTLVAKAGEAASRALGRRVTVVGGFEPSSLAPEGIGTGGEPGPPVVFSARTSLVYPLKRSTAGAAAAVFTFTQEFELERVESFPTTYSIGLPRGLVATGIDAPGASPAKLSRDGREFITLTPAAGGARATLAIAVTDWFILDQFWSYMVGGLLAAILAAVGVAALLRKRHRRRG